MAVQKEQIIFEGKSESLEKSLKNIQDGLKNLDKKLSKTSKQTEASFKKMGSSVGGLASKFKSLLPVLSAAGFAVAAKDAIELGDAIDKTSQKLGTSAEVWQQLSFAARQTSINTDVFAASIKALQRRSQLATESNNEYSKSYAKLGINAKEFANQPIEQKLSIIAERIKGVNSQTQKISIAEAILGEAGVQLLPLLDQGAAGIAKLRKEAVDLGVVLNGTDVKNLTSIGDEFSKIGLQLRTKFAAAFVKLKPLIDVVTKAVSEFLSSLNTEVISKFVVTAINGFASLLRSIADVMFALSNNALISDQLSEALTNIGLSANDAALKLTQSATKIKRGAADIKDAQSDQKDAIDKTVVATQAYTEKITQSVAAGVKSKVITDEQKLAMLDFARVLAGEITPAMISLRDKQEKLDEALKNGVLSQELYAKATAKVKSEMDALGQTTNKRAEQMKSIAQSAASEMQSNFENFFFNAMQGDFSNLADDFAKTLDRMVAKALAADLANALGFGSEGGAGTNLFSGILGGGDGGGIFGSIFGGSGGSGGIFGGLGDLFGGFFADGGPVQAGRPVLVGERGPEIFRPSSSGQIESNSGSKNVNVTMNISTPDADSFRQSQGQIVAEIAQSINAANGRDL